MKPSLASLVFAVVFLLFASNCAAEGEFHRPMWWSAAEQERTSDGGVAVTFNLLRSENMTLEGTDVFYLLISRQRSGGPWTYGEVEAYRKALTVGPGGSLSIKIYSGRTERIDLRGKFEAEGRIYYAQTIFSCYGESGVMDGTAERVADIPPWNAARLISGNAFYRPQTGSEITVATGVPGALVRVFEDGAHAADVKADGSGTCVYTPPHDESLAKSGYRAKKDLVFEIALQDGGYLSFSTPVYRAYYGQTSLAGGLALLSASALGSLSIVMYKNRRFRRR